MSLALVQAQAGTELLRTWTISSTPADSQRTRTFSITVKEVGPRTLGLLASAVSAPVLAQAAGSAGFGVHAMGPWAREPPEVALLLPAIELQISCWSTRWLQEADFPARSPAASACSRLMRVRILLSAARASMT